MVNSMFRSIPKIVAIFAVPASIALFFLEAMVVPQASAQETDAAENLKVKSDGASERSAKTADS